MFTGFIGFYEISVSPSLDIASSLAFIKSLSLPQPIIALDVGAGIGRVTRHLLAPLCARVDLLEPVSSLVAAQASYIGDALKDKIGISYSLSLRELTERTANPMPSLTSYSLVWVQWVTLYLLHDDDFVAFLRACSALLVKDGVLVLKENHTRQPRGFILDRSDASVTRSLRHHELIFSAAGLEILKSHRVTEFPDALFPVTMWALRPKH